MASQLKRVPNWLTRVLMPEVSEIKGDVKAINAKLDALDVKMDARFNELKAEIRTVETKVSAVDSKVESELRTQPRLSVLEEQVRELQRQRS